MKLIKRTFIILSIVVTLVTIELVIQGYSVRFDFVCLMVLIWSGLIKFYWVPLIKEKQQSIRQCIGLLETSLIEIMKPIINRIKPNNNNTSHQLTTADKKKKNVKMMIL